MDLDFLRPEFESQIEATIDEFGDVQIGTTTFDPASLLHADPGAYQAEFLTWIDYWLEEQRDRLSDILSLKANEKRFEDICSLDVIPLVGSGMSAPSGLPTWKDFLLNVREHSTVSENELLELLDLGLYEEAAELLQDKMPERLFDERIEHELRLLEGQEVRGPVKILPKIFQDVVLTTNLDGIIESIYEEQGAPFAKTDTAMSASTHRRDFEPEKPWLLKLHGESSSPTGRVVTRAEYDAAYGPGKPVREEIRRLCRTRALLCMGCSLRGDRTIEMLRDVANAEGGNLRHYAFLELPGGEDATTTREHFLVERNIFPIWYEGGHDESIQALLVGMLTSRGDV